MSRLELWYPQKPYVVTQAWGIANPSYLQFGFSKHNGIDYGPWMTASLRTPIKMEVTEIGFNNGAGNFLKAVTTDKWLVEGQEAYVGLFFMHNKEITVPVGRVLQIGEIFAIPDNTGFSTGTHSHLSCFMLADDKKTRIGGEADTNYTFDHSKYFTGYYAENYGVVINTYKAMVETLRAILNLWKK